MASFPEYVAGGSVNSAGGTPTDDDIGLAGQGLEDGDVIFLFTFYDSFAFAAFTWPDAAETRKWFIPLWGVTTYTGVGPYALFTCAAMMTRYNGDDSNLRMNGNSPPRFVAWVAYRGLDTFTFDSESSPSTDDVDYSGLLSDTLTVGDRVNYVGGGKNVSWLVFVTDSDNAVCNWSGAGVTALFTHSRSGVGTFSIAEQQLSGTGEWPTASCSYVATDPLSGFGGVSMRRFVPLFRQDGDSV